MYHSEHVHDLSRWYLAMNPATECIDEGISSNVVIEHMDVDYKNNGVGYPN